MMWERQMPRWAQLRSFTNQQNNISLHMDQRFLEAKAEHRMNKYVYPAWWWASKLYSNAQLCSVYNNIFMEIWWAGHIQYRQHWLSPGIVSVCLALVFGLGQRLCLQKVLNQNPCFKQTNLHVFGNTSALSFGRVTKCFKDVNTTDKKVFSKCLNTMCGAASMF